MFKYALLLTLITQVTYSANNNYYRNFINDFRKTAFVTGDEDCYKKIFDETVHWNQYDWGKPGLFKDFMGITCIYGHIKTLSYCGLCNAAFKLNRLQTPSERSKGIVVMKTHLHNFIKHGGDVKDLMLPVRVTAGVPHTAEFLKVLLDEGLPVSYTYKNEHDEYSTDDAICAAIEEGHPDNITLLLQRGSCKKSAIKSFKLAEKYLERLAICAPDDRDRIIEESFADEYHAGELVKYPEKKIAVEKGLWSEDRRAWIKACVATSHARYKPAVVSKKSRVEIVE